MTILKHDRVFDPKDPRHIGKVEIVSGQSCTVRWIERPEMISIFDLECVERVKLDVEGARERIEDRLVKDVSAGIKPGPWYADELKHFMEPGGDFEEFSNTWNMMVAKIIEDHGLQKH